MMTSDEIETDVRYMDEECHHEFSSKVEFGCWPVVVSSSERKLAACIQERSRIRLDIETFVRVIGLASQMHNSAITMSVEVRNGQICAEVSAIARDVMPPITSDDPNELEFAIGWFADRGLRFQLSVMPDHMFWIPL